MTDPAAAAWARMRAMVLDHDRRREAGRALGLSFVRVKALLVIDDGPRTMSELAGLLAVDSPYATVVTNDLAARGLVERRVHPDDRRGRLVVLTPAGVRAAARARRILETPPQGLRALEADQLEHLVHLLEAAQAAQAAQPAQAAPAAPATGTARVPGRTTRTGRRRSPARPAAPPARAGRPRSG